MSMMGGLPMASPDAAASMIFGRYQSNQNVIAAQVSSAVAGMWQRLVTDPNHFSDAWRRLGPIVQGIIDTYYQVSASDAAEYYWMSRTIAGYSGGTVPGSSLDPSYLSHVVNVMGNGQFYHFLKTEDAPTASVMARDALAGSAVRMVMNGGRNTVTRATSHDNVAMGWERIIEHQSCGYCSRLAASSGLHKAASEVFHAHDDCQCLARVVFQGQKPANTDLAGQWAQATAGRTGKAAVAAWNQYWSEKNGNSSGQHEVRRPEDATASPAEGPGDAALAVQSV